MRRYLLRSICIICNREFELVTPKQQTCSSNCAIIHTDNFIAEQKLKKNENSKT